MKTTIHPEKSWGKKGCIEYNYIQEETSSHSRVLAGTVVFLVIVVPKKIVSFLVNPPLFFW